MLLIQTKNDKPAKAIKKTVNTPCNFHYEKYCFETPKKDENIEVGKIQILSLNSAWKVPQQACHFRIVLNLVCDKL